MPQNAVSTNLPKAADAALTTRVRLRYLEQGDVWGSPVLFLHGLADSSFSFMPLMPYLPASMRAIAPDQRGHGVSDRPRAGYAPKDFARDALALMDSLGIERATFVGHSMGTFVAREAALAAPDRVAALMLIAPGATGRGPGLRELWQAVETMVDPVDPAFVREFQAGTIHRPLTPEFLNKVVEESLKVPARVWRAALWQLVAIDSAERARAIGCPTHILWGDQDSTFLRGEQDELSRIISDATLEVLHGVGHAVHWEAPEFVAQRLRRLTRA